MLIKIISSINFEKNKKSKNKKINKHNLIRQIEIVFYVLIVTTEQLIFFYNNILLWVMQRAKYLLCLGSYLSIIEASSKSELVISAIDNFSW